jgi:micrococcal nuclease
MKMRRTFWFLISLVLGLSFLGLSQTPSYRLCIRVIDGDTIILDGNETIRLIGVDTPETKDPRKLVQYYGQEAYEFTKSQVEGKNVRLEYDQQKIDKYGRTLAYVFLEDGTMLNSLIIVRGYGFAYTEFPFKHLDHFRSLEKMAKEWGAGLWAKQAEEQKAIANKAGTSQQAKKSDLEDAIVYVTKTGAKYHTGSCSYLSKSKIPMSLKDAVAAGYTPCSRCRPPTLK